MIGQAIPSTSPCTAAPDEGIRTGVGGNTTAREGRLSTPRREGPLRARCPCGGRARREMEGA
ncbi:Hypothetical protein A7982_03518 [Minicystis rosea]|nr:Hypothetical protein A7982_03518 [Minicystis rosea]